MNAPRLLIATFSMLLGSCAVTKVENSRFIGECMEILVPHYVAITKLDSSYSSKYMLSPEQVQSTSTRRVEIVGVVEPGVQVVVHEILRSPKIMSLGGPPFLRVTVQILNGEFAGEIADVPACVTFHPRQTWIMNCTLEPNAIQFNPEFARKCDTPLLSKP